MSLPPNLRSLVETPEPPELGPGPRRRVQAISEIDASLPALGLSSPRRELVRATVLLWHDHFHAAHAIVQDGESQDASYIHAILHRREPDYSNAKYWFRRVGTHPNFTALLARTESLLQKDSSLRAALLREKQWDSFAFVDACETAATRKSAGEEAILREIQRVEFELLLEHLTA